MDDNFVSLSATLGTKTITTRHNLKIILTKNFQCEYCSKNHKTFKALIKHKVLCMQRKSRIKRSRKLIKDYTCNDCGQTFKYARILEKHSLMHKSENPYWCKLCMENFATYEEKIVHKMQQHPRKAKTPKCRLCSNLTFKSEEEYLCHTVELHRGKNEHCYMCSVCGKQFKTKNELTLHNNSKCGTIKQFKCKICDQFLMTAGSLHNHMLRHTGERCCMCGYCGKLFLTPGQLKVHERSHTQEKAFVCSVCNKGFCHRQSLITHFTTHTGIKPFECDNCGNSFSCVGNLIKHRRTHSDTCGATPLTTHRVDNPSTKNKVKMNTPKTAKLKAIRKEKELQEKVAAFKESLNSCNVNSNDEALNEIKTEPNDSDDIHFLERLNNEPDNLVKKEVEIVEITHKNEECKKEENIQIEEVNIETIDVRNEIKDEAEHVEETFETVEHQDYASDADEGQKTDNFETKPVEKKQPLGRKTDSFEIKLVESSENKQTKIIPAKTVDKEEIVEEKGVSESNKTKSVTTAAASCKYCKKVYTKIRCLIKHEKQHEHAVDEIAPNLPYKCSCCKQHFETIEACKAHRKNEHADILTCFECDKIFSAVVSLRSHQNTHHKGIPKKTYVYVCEKCGWQFRQKALLMHHNKNECGAPNQVYECHICGKGFSSVHIGKTHLRIHDPKKKFLCKFCGKSFRWKGQLKIHERSHTGEKPFKCLYCPKTFAYRESLITHSTVHTGFKPHLCEACGSRFSCIGNLIKHRVTHASTCGVWYSKNK